MTVASMDTAIPDRAPWKGVCVAASGNAAIADLSRSFSEWLHL
jgi:hypothetical protein